MERNAVKKKPRQFPTGKIVGKKAKDCNVFHSNRKSIQTLLFALKQKTLRLQNVNQKFSQMKAKKRLKIVRLKLLKQIRFTMFESELIHY